MVDPEQPSLLYDLQLTQFIHRERLRPYYLFASNATGGVVDAIWQQRYRCHISSAEQCYLHDQRLSAQPARILINQDRSDPTPKFYLRTGTMHRFNRPDHFVQRDAFLTLTFYDYGTCRAKEDGGQISLGDFALVRSEPDGWHHTDIVVDSDGSDADANEIDTHTHVTGAPHTVRIGLHLQGGDGTTEYEPPSNDDDGYIYGASAVDYATSRATSTATDDASDTLRVGQSKVGATYTTYRTLLRFDTSGLAGTTVTAAKLVMTVIDKAGVASNFDVNIHQCVWSGDLDTAPNRETVYDDAVASDYDQNLGQTISMNVGTSYESNALDTSYINTVGYTTYAVLSEKDTDNVAPTGLRYIDFASSTHATAAYRPYLEVTYTGGGEYQRDGFFRFPISLAADAVILKARLTFLRVEEQTESCWVRVFLQGRSNMAEYSEVSAHADNPSRGNANAPYLINCHDSDEANLFEITAGSDDGYCKLDELAEVVQRFIGQANYAPGNYMGVAVVSEASLNTTTDNAITAESFDWPLGARLYITYRDSDSEENPVATEPPRLYGYQRFMLNNTENNPDPDDEGFKIDRDYVFTNVPDQWWANSYRYFSLIPVDPLSDWPALVDLAITEYPYDEDGPNRFPLNDCGTYEVPCYSRINPRRMTQLGLTIPAPSVPPGLRGIVAFSSDPAHWGSQVLYGAGCGAYNGELNMEGGTAQLNPTDKFYGLVENTVRVYKGMTGVKTWTWTSDPADRGWSVTYYSTITAYFTCDAYWSGWAQAELAEAFDDGSYIQHWNCWYVGKIHAVIRGNTLDAGFAAWIAAHQGGFGATYTPRYSNCSDALMCLGVSDAMGDTRYPDTADQNDCKWSDQTIAELPCRGEGKYSYAYFPNLGSNHPKTPVVGNVIPQQPEYGLYHETKTVKFTNRELTETETVYGHAVSIFQSLMPRLVEGEIADPGDYVNEIQRIRILNTYGIEDPPGTPVDPDSGWFNIGTTEDASYVSLDIGPGAAWTAADVQTALEACDNIGEGNVSVTLADAGVEGAWDVQFIGEFAGRNMPLLIVHLNVGHYLTYSGTGECAGYDPPCYAVEVTVIQDGTGAGHIGTGGWRYV